MAKRYSEIIRLFFSLLRSALWAKPSQETVTAQQFPRLMDLAKAQTVSGLMFDVLRNIRVEDERQIKTIVHKAYFHAEKIKKKNAELDKELTWFAGQIAEHDLRCIVVKGQLIARLYPKMGTRHTGDIDFLIPQEAAGTNTTPDESGTELQKIAQIFPEAHIPEKLQEKEFAFRHEGRLYELHARLTDFGCKKHEQLWESWIAKEWQYPYYVELDGVKVRTLSPTMNAAYLFVHLFFHLIREGVSLRQFCDWAMFLHAYREAIDRQQLADFMQGMDMVQGYKAMGSILVDDLGLPEEEFPMPLTEADRHWKMKILSDIFRGGSFGKQNHHAKSKLGRKMETLRMAMRNSVRYRKLSPSEMRMMIPKMMKINLKLI